MKHFYDVICVGERSAFVALSSHRIPSTATGGRPVPVQSFDCGDNAAQVATVQLLQRGHQRSVSVTQTGCGRRTR